jgi:hypothetical protein
VTAQSSATAGEGNAPVATANASTTATGASGTLSATAGATLMPGNLITSVAASAGGVVQGTGVAQARADVGGAAPAFATTDQVAALEMAAPTSASTAAVLAANTAIATAFGASPDFFAIDELGGQYSSAGTSSQTTTSEVDATVDLTQLASPGDLIVGLYDGTALGTGVTGVSFNLYADGVDVIDQTFTSAAAAQTYFTDNAVDVGSLASGGALGASTLTLQAVMTVTGGASGSGFFGGLIIGDPPPAGRAGGGVHALIQAQAAFAPPASASVAASRAADMGMGATALSHPGHVQQA